MRKYFVSFLSFAILLNPLLSFAKQGTTAMDFLKIEAGAKARGMGGAFSAVSDDPSAVYWNPAGLADIKSKQLSLMYLSWFEGINYQFMSYSQTINKKSAFAASIYYLSMGEIDSYNNSGALLDNKLNVSDLAAALSYARNINGINCAVTGKIMRENLADVSANAYAFDIGFLYKAKHEINIALSAQNIGPDVKYIQKEDPLPANYRAGLSKKLFNNSLTAAIDANFPLYEDNYLNFGLDYKITDWVSVRTGYTYKAYSVENDAQTGLVGGFGFGNEFISIDYAFVPYGILGNTHRVGINYKFGKIYKESLIETNIHKHLSKAIKYYSQNDLINSRNEFNNVLAMDPVNTKAKEYIAKIEQKVNEVNLQKYLVLVKEYLEKEQIIEAKELIDKILLLFPENADAKSFHKRIEVVFQQQKAVRLESMFKQGLEFYDNKNYSDALTLWEKVLLVNPDHLQAKEYIQKAKEELAKIEETQKKQMREKNIVVAAEAFKQAEKLFKNKSFNSARQLFEKAKQLNPELTGIDNYLSQIDVKIAEDYYLKGLNLYKTKKLKEALDSWKEALKYDPQNSKISDEYKKAENELNEINMAEAEKYSRQGLKEYGLGNLESAVKLLEKALSFDPENTKIKNNLNRAKDELEKKK